MDVTFQIQGLAQMLTKLERATAPATLAPAFHHAQERLLEKLTEYPPVPEGSTYERTGALRDGWRMDAIEGLEATLENDVPYAPLVQRDPAFDDPHQAWMHQGWWPTDKELIDEVKEEVAQDFGAAIQRVFDGA